MVLVPHHCHRPRVPANSELQRSPCSVSRQPKLQPQESIQSDSTAITTRLAMNIQTRARAFQNPFQLRKDSFMLFTRSTVRNAPINVPDVRRTTSQGQSIARLCVASPWIYGTHTVESMRHSTPTQPSHMKSRTQTTPEQGTHKLGRQTHFRWRNSTIIAFVAVYQPAHANDRPSDPPTRMSARASPTQRIEEDNHLQTIKQTKTAYSPPVESALLHELEP